MPPSPTLADVQAAARRLEGITIRTPLLENQRVNAMLGGRLFLKAECLERTGSFKLRGAYNFLASMSEAERKKGAVGWSSGNHAQGLAEAARLSGHEGHHRHAGRCAGAEGGQHAAPAAPRSCSMTA